MENIILDVDAGLVAFCLDAAPRIQRYLHWCWWSKWIDRVLWRRLFPPDIWGPDGPWGRVTPVVKSILYVVAVLAVRLLGRLFRRR
jgi:hypothetical protein